MKAIFSLEEARKLDHSFIKKYSLSESSLIDGAAMGAYHVIKDQVYKKRILFLIGKGNNGSDGLELARILSEEGADVHVFYLKGNPNEENARRRGYAFKVVSSFSPYDYDVIIDALCGFGFHGDIEDDILDLVERVNDSGCYTISLDVPSFMQIIANETIVFMFYKLELFNPLSREKFGMLQLVNPGFDEHELSLVESDVYLIEHKDLDLKPFSISDYKNTRGHVAVIGGSEKYPGAPILSAKSAIKSGSGLVTLISTDEVRGVVLSSYPSIMVQRASEVDFSIFSSIAIGPGWGSGDERLFELAIESGKPIVIDADALKFVPGKNFGMRAVITPHLGEYKRLCKTLSIDNGLSSSSKLKQTLLDLSRRLGAIIVLKGSTVWISNGEKVYIYDGHNPSLGVAGSGDVLTGIVASLLASGQTPLRSAIEAVILHQEAGLRANKKFGYYLADELIMEIERP